MAQSQICIIGAGISGLVLGRCLLRYGIRAVLFEKTSVKANRNLYGITLHSSAYKPLLDVLEIEERNFRDRIAVDSAIGGVGRINGQADTTSVRAHRSRFEKLLAEGLDIQYNHTLESLEIDGTSTKLKFANGAEHEAQIVVGADGTHSQVRHFVSAKTQFQVLPYAVYNGKRRLAIAEFNNRLKEHFDTSNTVECRTNGSLFQISIDDYNEDWVSISYNYSRPPIQDNDPLYRPTRSKDDAKAIPEALFQELSAQYLQEPYKTVFDPIAMKNDRLLNWLMRSVLVEQHDLEKVLNKDIVLIGEAAHAEPILGGYGANEAIKDGIELAQNLSKQEDLSEFYNLRFSDWQDGVKASERRIEEMHSNARPSL